MLLFFSIRYNKYILYYILDRYMHPYDIIEDPSSGISEIRNAIETLVFEEKKNPDPVSNSFETAEMGGIEPSGLLDEVARNRLNHMYAHRNRSNNYPSLLENWKGDATEGTPELLSIARGEQHPDRDRIKKYQQKMRSKLPSRIPLVRGGGHNSKQLESWSAEIGVARRYSNNKIMFTIAEPNDVFMCSKYGPRIGEQEYTLINTRSVENYQDCDKTHIKLYQKMDQILD